MGSGEVAHYVARHGADRVARVVLTSPIAPVTAKRDMFEAFSAALKQDRPGFMTAGLPMFLGRDTDVSPAMARWVLDQFLRASPKALIECNRAIAVNDHRAQLQAMTMPTLIIQGDKDEVGSLEHNARPLAAGIASSELRVYEGAPHGIVLTHRDRFTQDLLGFVR
jgi:non-heme chloroperoxidase